MPKKPAGEGAIATNRKARHDYDIEQTFEVGIALVGSEVKSLRDGKASLAESYATIRKDEVFVYNMHIAEYPQASMQNHDPIRPRKLLLHRAEISKIRAKMEQQGYTLVPLKLYFKTNKVKLELALARGRKRHDKRQAIMKREHQRDMARASGAARKAGR
ncbi:MAG TPA: SsrA-binding protein SmpB [Actinomycetota bacterium]|nr:SsrA-binding protein SmpB [Actinomycetota bacterium]